MHCFDIHRGAVELAAGDNTTREPVKGVRGNFALHLRSCRYLPAPVSLTIARKLRQSLKLPAVQIVSESTINTFEKYVLQQNPPLTNDN